MRRRGFEAKSYGPPEQVRATPARCPDGPLVEVDSNREHVRIHKQGRSLFIDVDSEEETVHVSFRLQAAADTVSQLAR